MLPQSMKIMEDFQVRKSKKQKEAFRAWLCGELEAAGCAPKVEGGFAAKNVVAGDPDTAKVIFSAHYDTCAVLPIPNFITPRNMFFYICYQLLMIAPLFLVIAAAEAVLLAVIVKLQSPELLLLMPVTSIALCAFFVWWIIDGPANKHTANDNTSGVITLLEAALSMPDEDRKQVCFVFFDNEEKGMLGSAAFARRHKKAKKNTPVLNFDCVGDGDSIQFFPRRRLKKDQDALERIQAAFLPAGGRDVQVVRGFGLYPSDNASFRKGVGVCALKHRPVIGYYMDHIHTSRDTVLDEVNITLLRDGALRYIAGLS